MKPRKLAVGTPVKFKWADSDYAQGWHYPQGVMTYPTLSPKPTEIATIGWVVATSRDSLIVTTSIGENGGALTPVSVPWRAIFNLEVLNKKRRSR